ncbi:MAG: glutamate--tRNA ligase [Eubacteriales bacterium]
MDYTKLADFLFQNITKTSEYYESLFPTRDLPKTASVTRLAPSPTGFIHLGNLYGGFADERLAHQSDGIFYLRIEDTDDKRYVDGAVEIIINSLKFFGINFDEGASLNGDLGIYGPYTQSLRGEIYQCYVKELVAKGMAYPCFMSSEELNEIHDLQEKNKENFGIYGKWAKSRHFTFDEIKEKIDSGVPYVIRLRANDYSGLSSEDVPTFTIIDGIRGPLTIPRNGQDTVLLKANGIPTYHFAHVVDDHLMRTTHVLRGEEWLSSLPIHVDLFERLEFEMPIFCHTAHLMKIDEETGQKRKLSKRKDPELSLDYYRQDGYHPAAVREYLLTLLNSNFEEWRIANPDSDINEFKFSLEKMGNTGALFDLNKLHDISKDVLLKLPADNLYDFLLNWATETNASFKSILENKKEMILKILDIGRSGQKPRKDLIYAKQIVDFISYFFDETFTITDNAPDNVSASDEKAILAEYLKTYNHSDNQEEWFEKIRTIADTLGYAKKPKDYKKNPELYKGHVGDVSTVIRLAIVGRAQSPDIHEIQQILGESKTLQRIEKKLQS